MPAAFRSRAICQSGIFVIVALTAIAATRHQQPPTQTPTPPDAATVKPAICSQVQNADDCRNRYPAGCDSQGKYDATLAFLKNRTDFPATAEGVLDRSAFLDKEKNLPTGLSSDNHKNFLDQLAALGETHIYQTVGYLYEIKAEKGEACNCELLTPDTIDYHMYIGYDAARAAQLANGAPAKLADEAQSVIVEITPQIRVHSHPEWQYATLKKLAGKQVRITGQLLADNEHYVHGEDCALGQTATCFRATIWELHPVTLFETCTSGDCTATSGTWAAIPSIASH
jgi:hypothetical protein